MVALEVLLYGLYAGALVVNGLGIGLGLLPGSASPALTIVPAVLAALAIVAALWMGRTADALERRLRARAAAARPRAGRWWQRAAGVPRAVGDGIHSALGLIRTRRAAPIAALSYWAFDIGTLWASFHAFGPAPSVGVLVLGYLIGTLGSVIPLPGGIGGVEGAMIGAFLAFGVDPGLAVLAVLAYRTISYWLPTLPGLVAYVRLRQTVGRWRAPANAESTGG
jgi:uncharacterized membrane protein YbhN (UPF0104 family)